MKVINRIKDSDDFASTIKHGRTIRNQSFTIHYAVNNMGHTRVGISVSKKLGNAVKRNRIKRQIRSMCRNLINFDANELDLVIIAKNNFTNNSFGENQSLLSDLLNTQVGIKK